MSPTEMAWRELALPRTSLIPDFSLHNTEEQLPAAKVLCPVKLCHSDQS